MAVIIGGNKSMGWAMLLLNHSEKAENYNVGVHVSIDWIVSGGGETGMEAGTGVHWDVGTWWQTAWYDRLLLSADGHRDAIWD